MFKDDIEPERWAGIVEREVWLRLAKMRSWPARSLGRMRGDDSTRLSAQYPQWQLARR